MKPTISRRAFLGLLASVVAVSSLRSAAIAQDDSAWIQSAVEAAHAAGTRFVLKPGTYRINRPVRLLSDELIYSSTFIIPDHMGMMNTFEPGASANCRIVSCVFATKSAVRRSSVGAMQARQRDIQPRS